MKRVRLPGSRIAARTRSLRIESLEERRLLATVQWDGGGDGTSWSDAANWDVGGANQLPAAGDDVVIDVPGSDPTIVYNSGSVSLASLTSNEALNISGGSITINGTGQINADLTMGDADLIADGPAATIAATSSSNLFQATLRALNGGSIVIPATSYAEGNSTLEADGAGSLLDLSSVTTLSGGGFIRTLVIRADNGGVVDLSGLTEVTGGATHMLADGAGSRIDATALTSFVDTNGNRSSLISPTNGGEVDAPLLTDLSAVNVTLDATGVLATHQLTALVSGTMSVTGQPVDLDGLTDMTNAKLELHGGATASVANLSMIDGASFEVYDGVTLTLPSTTSYVGQSNPGTIFRAHGTGTRLDLSTIETLSGGSFVSTLFIEAEDGGVVELGGLTEITGGATQLTSDGTNSLVDLPLITSFVDTNGNRASLLAASAGGTINVPQLAGLAGININLGVGGNVQIAQMTSYTQGTATVDGTAANLSGLVDVTNSTFNLLNGGTVDLANASNIHGASFLVNDGVTLALPSASSYVGQSNPGTIFRATGPGSRLDLSTITTLSGGSFVSTLFIEAEGGGVVDLGSLTEITGGATQITADGTSSVVDAPMLASFVDTNGNRASTLEPINGGEISAPMLTTLSAIQFTLDGTGTLPTAQMTSVTNCTVASHSVASDFSGITNFTNSSMTVRLGGTANLSNATMIDGASFNVYDGVTLSVPGGTSYVGQSHSGTFFRADGVGSVLDLSALTSISGGSFISALVIEGTNGGTVDLSNTTGFTGGATHVTADGGTVDLSQATEFTDTNGNVASILTARNGGNVNFNAHSVAVDAVTVTLTDTGSISAGTLDLGVTAILDGAGTLDANLVNRGRVRPGSSPGAQTILGDFTQTPTGRLEVELGGLAAVTEHDVLQVSGHAAFDGTLSVTLVNGFVPTELESFEIVTHGSSSETFTVYEGTDLASGLVLDPNFGTNELTLNTFPELSLTDASIVEGDAGTSQLVFDLAMSVDVGYDVFVDFQSSDDFATAGEDYVMASGTLMIPMGATTGTIAVDILGDVGLERDEPFFLSLLNPQDAALGDVVAVGTIQNDDVLPGIAIADLVGVEPVNGTTQFDFEVTLSAPSPDPLQVSFATTDISAIAGADYVATSGGMSFVASATRGLTSDGSDGVFAPVTHTTVALPPDGVLNYSSVHIPAGVNVTFTRNAANTPVILLSQGDLIVDGTINLSASNINGGPGGGDGGLLGVGLVDGLDGLGVSPGTGGGAMAGFVGSPGGGGGLGTSGLDPTNRPGPLPGIGGPAVPFPEELNERGGSGGGGGGGWQRTGVDLSGGSGGGGGGGIVAASSHGTIIVSGTIRSNGANGGTAFANAFGWGGAGGGGSGGVIDLQADRIEIAGTLEAVGGQGGGIGTIQPGNPNFSSQAHGGLGYVRLTTSDLVMAGTVNAELISRDFDVKQIVSVTVSSDLDAMEPDEMFDVSLSAPVNGLVTRGVAVGTIIDAQPGDFDGDGDFDATDIDAMIAAIAAGAPDGLFDLSGDGSLTVSDRDLWLSLAGNANLGPGRAYLLGDATLDGNVDDQDFAAWNTNKFTPVAAWTMGDFNADGIINGRDFLIWNANKFTSSETQAAAEEVAAGETEHSVRRAKVFSSYGVETTKGSSILAPVPAITPTRWRAAPEVVDRIHAQDADGLDEDAERGDSLTALRERYLWP